MKKKWMIVLALLAFGLVLDAALVPQTHMPPGRALLFSGPVPNKP